LNAYGESDSTVELPLYRDGPAPIYYDGLKRIYCFRSYAEAESLFKRAVSITERISRPADTETAQMLNKSRLVDR
jgi:hypothetical protein